VNESEDMRIKFPVLLGTLVFLAFVLTLFAIGAIPLSGVLSLIVLGQLVMFCLDGRRPALFMATLTQSQIEEFSEIMENMKGYDGLFKELPDRLKNLERENDDLRSQVKSLRKRGLAGGGGGIRTIGTKDFVSDEAARALAAHFIIECQRVPNALESYIKDEGARKRITQEALMASGFANVKAALDSTTTPLPTVYTPQVIELVWMYGQARQYATVFPLGSGTVKLPRLKAGEDDFGYLGAGTGGFSQSVAEKRVTAELVTFTANKVGGIIRMPTEIEEDTFIPLGQFLARYIARQFAKIEDKTLFIADGTSTYANITGVATYCVNTPAYLQQLLAGKTKPSDVTVSDFRNMRTKVNLAVLVNNAAYYMHPSMEAVLVTFNTINNPLIYQRQIGNTPASLDGFPIRWINASQAFSTIAAPSANLAFFGDLSYWYLGERGSPRIEVSREVFFGTDEVAMRALERIDVEAMAVDAISTLQTAAA
jgi:HK97 family phage major capsid protein